MKENIQESIKNRESNQETVEESNQDINQETTKDINQETTKDTTLNKTCLHCEKKKVRDKDSKEYKNLISRLNRIEGQVRGIRKMVEEDRYCIDILTQVSAISSALNGFSKELLTRHIKSCVVEDIKDGHEETVEELCNTLQKLMK